MATISNTLKLQDKMSSTLSTITKALHSTLLAMESIKGANVGAEFKNAANDIKQAQKAVDDFNKSLQNSNQESKNVSTAIDVFMGNALTKVADKAIFAGKQLIAMSDDYVSNTARLDRFNDGLQTTAELQDIIYSAAQRSRGSYAAMISTVAQLGNQAGEAFNNNSKEVIAFSELLNKTFTLSGMDTTAIESVMYNMTQSLSSGKLLGQDYRILKQNAPQMIAYLRDFYNVNQAGLDEMVSQGKVTSQELKMAMFNAADDINAKFNKMPLTWGQLWTKISNQIQKSLEPLLKVINQVAQFISDNWTTIQMILEALIITIGIATIAWVAYKAATIAVSIATAILNGTLVLTNLLIGGLIVVIFGLVLALIYLWNTNDDAAYYMLLAWDGLQVGVLSAVLVLKGAFYSVLDAIEYMKIGGLAIIDGFINQIIAQINKLISFLNMLPGVSIEAIGYTSNLAMEQAAKSNEAIQDRANEIAEDTQKLFDKTREMNATREERVQNRKKVGEGLGDTLGNSFGKGLGDAGVIGSDGKGGKALKTTSNDRLLTDEDIQLLLDVATRDYQLNYQQITPNVSVTFGDIRETADVNSVMDAVGTAIEELLIGDAEVRN